MKIASAERYDENELIKRLRNVTMLEDKELYPYRHASISLEKICIEELHPPQRYVLKSELYKVRELKWELEKFNIDIFDIGGFVRITLDNIAEPIDLLPPIIEEVIERNGRITHIINDGMHRVYMAYLEWVIPQVVFVRGLPKGVPYYSFPIPEQDWKQIEIRDDLPEGFIKKWHRIAQNKKLYRNFNSAFKNVGGPRGNPTQRG